MPFITIPKDLPIGAFVRVPDNTLVPETEAPFSSLILLAILARNSWLEGDDELIDTRERIEAALKDAKAGDEVELSARDIAALKAELRNATGLAQHLYTAIGRCLKAVNVAHDKPLESAP